jgi:hypothetical protein
MKQYPCNKCNGTHDVKPFQSGYISSNVNMTCKPCRAPNTLGIALGILVGLGVSIALLILLVNMQ